MNKFARGAAALVDKVPQKTDVGRVVSWLFRRGAEQQALNAINALAANGQFDVDTLDRLRESLRSSSLANVKSLRYYLASLYLQLGQVGHANELLKVSGRPSRELKWFAAVLLHCREHAISLPVLGRQEWRCLEYLADKVHFSDTAMASLFHERESFAVVGNAPGSQLNAFGAECGSVFFNDYQCNTRLKGTPLLHVVTPSWKLVNSLPTNYLCITGNSIFHRRSRVWRQFLDQPNYEKIFTLPRPLWSELSFKLQAPPSAGLALLAYFAGYVDLSGKIGVISGYSSFTGAINHSYDSIPLSSRHNWSAELGLRRNYIDQIKSSTHTLTYC